MNLKDRNSSDSSSLQPNRNLKKQEELKKNENTPNTNSTSQRSKQLSPDIIMKKQSETIQQLITENTTLRKQIMERSEGNPDTEQTISDLSSQISMLKKKVLDQKQEIVDLNEKNAKLNSSDLQLKEARSMKEQAEQDMREATTLVSDFEKHKESMIAALDEREAAISKKEKIINAIKSDLEGEIRKRVDIEVSDIEHELEIKYRKKVQNLREEYDNLKAEHWIVFIVALIGSLLSFISMVILSKPLQKELSDFLLKLLEVLKKIGMFPINVGDGIASGMCGLPDSSGGYIAIMIISFVVLHGLMIVVLVLSGKFLIENISDWYDDDITKTIGIIIVVISIFFSPAFADILPINTFTLDILILAAYTVVRFMTEWDMQETKKQVLCWILIITASYLIVKGLLRIC